MSSAESALGVALGSDGGGVQSGSGSGRDVTFYLTVLLYIAAANSVLTLVSYACLSDESLPAVCFRMCLRQGQKTVEF